MAKPQASIIEGRFCDADIRRVLRHALAIEFAGDRSTIILDEFDCAGARADLAVVNGKLHGFEIKSERDSLDRIENQVRAYSLIFDSVTAVVAAKHVGKLTSRIPSWWGITVVGCEDGCPTLTPVRQKKQNTSLDVVEVARLLWRSEAYAFLKHLDLAEGMRTAPAVSIRRRLVENVPLGQIAFEVRRVLKLRVAESVAKRPFQNGGSYTIEPTAAVRQKNLNWLLSLQASHPQC